MSKAHQGKPPQKDHSRWKLKVRILRKSKDDTVWRVELKTQPMPPNPLSQQNVEDPHPFSQLGEEYFRKGLKRTDAVVNGIFREYIANNEVTRAILNIIGDPEALEASGSTDWRWYRMMLVTTLDSLWD